MVVRRAHPSMLNWWEHIPYRNSVSPQPNEALKLSVSQCSLPAGGMCEPFAPS